MTLFTTMLSLQAQAVWAPSSKAWECRAGPETGPVKVQDVLPDRNTPCTVLGFSVVHFVATLNEDLAFPLEEQDILLLLIQQPWA